MPIFDLIEITSLHISCKTISIYRIVQLLNLLPNLRSLRLSGFPFGDLVNTLDPELAVWERFLATNKITKLAIIYSNQIEDITRVISLFPRIHHLIIQPVPDTDLKTVIRCALSQIQKVNICDIKNLCIFVNNAKHDQVQRLQRMINSKELLRNYAIHRQMGRFYLLWK